MPRENRAVETSSFLDKEKAAARLKLQEISLHV